MSLTEIFNVKAEPATGASILVWIIQLVPTLALGLVLLIHEGLSIRKLEAITEEEEQAVTLEEASLTHYPAEPMIGSVGELPTRCQSSSHRSPDHPISAY